MGAPSGAANGLPVAPARSLRMNFVERHEMIQWPQF